MSEQKVFTVTKVAWHTKRPGNPDPPEVYLRRFWILADFLQRNGLTVRELATSASAITDEFEIRSNDLTTEGLGFVRTGYQKWLRGIDSGKDPSDTRVMERELAKLRSK